MEPDEAYTESVAPDSEPLYKDFEAPIEERISDLISRMTLKEKVSQMLHDAPAIDRLDVPRYNWWNECLHGVARAGIATSFPQAIGLAATWDAELMSSIATAISDEARAKHHEMVRKGVRDIYTGLTFWSPNINIFRDPRWGRGQETYGEDPYLISRFGVAFVKGLQGDDPRYLKLVATPKHFAVHSGREADRHHFNAEVSPRDMWETYLPAFEACVRDGKAYSVMGAYNRTHGEPCCASPTLLQEILREKWGFEGYVVSDCWAIRDIYAHHRIVETPAEAAALAVNAGCDLNCGDTFIALMDAVEQGLISEETIDQAVGRLFAARFRLGMFDPPQRVPYAQIPCSANDSAEHRALALQAARESIVLLKNEADLLPLRKDLSAIAVVGPNADDMEVLLGNYNGTPSRAVTALESIRQKVTPDTQVYYAQGCELAAGVAPLSIIASNYLRPADGGIRLNGLKADYYDNPGFEGTPVSTRIDSVIDFVWSAGAPVSGRPAESFAVRWAGMLIPPVSGKYRIGARGYTRYRVVLDGELVSEYAGIHHPVTVTREVELVGGRLYRIEVEYANTATDPQVQLLWSIPGVDYAQQALELARKADVVVMVMGISAALEGEEMPIEIEGFDRGDRTALGLPRPQEELLERIHALGKPVVLVLMNGSALAVNWAKDNIPAIVEAWYPGQAGGEALADVLFGDYNPGGRLPVTFYRSVEDLPPFEDYRMDRRTYRYFRGETLYPFGYGLSYTTFEYRDLKLSAKRIGVWESVEASVEVKNTGKRAGDETVQLYVSDLAASASVPLRQLQGFSRIHLAPGEQKTVTFTLPPRAFSIVNDEGRRIIEPGAFQIAVGGRQPEMADIAARTTGVLIANLEVIGQTSDFEER
jgi:beta-glucosidase